MTAKLAKNIGICAPSRAITRDLAEQVRAFAAQNFADVTLHFHEQCFAAHGHFAGSDAERTAAFVAMANDPALDAVWFARGGYGAARMTDAVIQELGPVASAKSYMGYSDGGNMLGAMYAAGIGQVCHGPMVSDISRSGGEAAIARALGWLSHADRSVLEPDLSTATPQVALNLMTLGMMSGWEHCPDLNGHIVLIEEVGEHLYAIDRMMFHMMNNFAGIKADDQHIAGVRLGRVSAVPPNDIDFAMTAEEIVSFWCARHNIPYLGRADIGHDVDNKIVPFGQLSLA